MSVSNQTADELARILIEEFGSHEEAIHLIKRIVDEVPGNKSFRDTMRMVQERIR